MAEYLIQDYTMEALANQARRVSGTTGELSGAEIAEIISKVDGKANLDGKYLIKAVNNTGTALKLGMYDEGQIFALPTEKPISSIDTFQEWVSPIPSNKHFLTVKNMPTVVGAVMTPNEDVLVIGILTTENNKTVTFNFWRPSGLFIDWGDGTTEICESSSSSAISHTYSQSDTYYYIKIPKHDGLNTLTTCLTEDLTTASMLYHISVPTWISQYFYIHDLTMVIPDDSTGLRSISISKGAMSYLGNMCKNNKRLQCAIIPSSIKTLYGTFNGCHDLSNVILPYGLEKIDQFTFEDCYNLENIIIPATVTDIVVYLTLDCGHFDENEEYIGNLKAFFVDEDNPNYSNDGQGILYNKDKTTLVRVPCSLTNITIPNDVTVIGNWAFYRNNIASITIPDNVISINKEAFKYCGALKNVVIGNGVTTIGKSAFSTCSMLESVVIGNGVTTIGDYAFYINGTNKIKTIEIPASVTAIGKNIFSPNNSPNIVFENPNGWYVTQTEGATSGINVDVSNGKAAWYQYRDYYWYRTQ